MKKKLIKFLKEILFTVNNHFTEYDIDVIFQKIVHLEKVKVILLKFILLKSLNSIQFYDYF